jgi:hypothetical protein
MADKIRYVGNAIRKEKEKKNFKRYLSLILALALIIISALAGLNIARKTSAEAYDGQQGGSFPVSFSTNDIKDAKVMDKTIVVLTKKFVTAIDKGGDIVWEHSIAYGDPAVFTSRNYTVVFDRLSNKYAIIDKYGVITERRSDISSQIFNAKVTDDGSVLLSLRSDSSSSMVCLKDKKGEDKLIWSCTQEYVTDLALSDNGKTLFCGSIGASGGEMYTKVYALTVKNGHEKSYTLPSSTCIYINAVSSDKFNLVTTKGMYVFDASEEEMLISSQTFSSKLIYCASDAKGNVAAVTDSTSDISHNTLTVYNGKGEAEYSLSLEAGIEDIFTNEEEALILYKDYIISVKNGEINKKLFFENKAAGVIKVSNQVYCYSLGGVEKARIK